MKTLYLECAMGAAGDMLLAAMFELLPDKAAFLDELNRLGLPGVAVAAEKSVKCGVCGTHIRVSVHGAEETPAAGVHGHAHDGAHTPAHDHAHNHAHTHGHNSMHEISALLAGLPVSAKARRDAAAVYALIAAAEAEAHGCPVELVHFHEVGALDAVADIVGVCLAVERLAPARIIASPVATGSGHVHCAHGMLPVPAPATALLLRGVPNYSGAVAGELCTPTGAALLRHFAGEFGPRPVMTCTAVGYGMGSRDFPQINCVRAFLGESAPVTGLANGTVTELCCNLDDMTAEDIGFALETLLANGALDAFTVAAQMKKNRPGLLLTCVCRDEDADRLAALLLRHTSSFGLRRRDCARYTLARENETRQTVLGPVRFKRGFGFGVEKEKAEYEDVAAIARREGLSIRDARRCLETDDA